MGVLEDAIREHLDLRRRHGAAEDELRDQEAEALGPARREVDEEVEPGESAELADAPIEPADEPTRIAESPVLDETESGIPFDGAEDERPAEPVLEGEPVVADEREDEAEPVPMLEPDEPLAAAGLEEPVTEVGSRFDEPYSGESPAEELPPEEELPAQEEPPPEEPPPEQELPAEEEPPPADAPPSKDADDDVLEETPDFLSETPEHDRLWFEQKPPRDFDFD